jgi:hypothetical protein
MNKIIKQHLASILLIFILAAFWLSRNAYSAGSLTPPGPPSPTGFSLDELAAQIAAVKADIATVQSSVSALGVKQVIRGTLSSFTTSAAISPTVVPSKCTVTLRAVFTSGTTTSGQIGEPAIVSSLTSSAITIQYASFGGNFKVEYEIVEYN